jgi:O-antigen/teichoic acid export membrane protein
MHADFLRAKLPTLSIYRTIARHTAIYSLALAAGKMASFFLLPVYTRYLTPADYGAMELMDLVGFILAALFCARIADALFYFYSQASSEEGRAKVVGTSFFTAVLLGVGGATAGWLMVEPISRLVFNSVRYAEYFRISFLNIAFLFPLEIGFGYLRVLNRSAAFVVCQLARLAVTAIVTVILMVHYQMGISAILWGSAVGTGSVAAGLSVFLLARIGVHLNLQLAARIFRYAAPLGLSAVGMTILHSGDRFFLQRTVTLDEVGIYALGYKFGMLVAYSHLAFLNYWSSQMFEVVRMPKGDHTYVRICTYFLLVLAATGVVVSAFSVPVIRVMTTPAFHGATVLVPVIAAAYVIRGLGDFFRSVFGIHNRPHLNAKVTFGAVVATMIAYAVLIPLFRMWGAAMATVLGFLVMDGLALYEAQKVRAYAFEWRRMLLILLASALAVGCALLLRPSSLLLQGVVAVSSTALFPAALWTLGFFDADEKDAIRTWRHRIGVGVRRSAVGGGVIG